LRQAGIPEALLFAVVRKCGLHDFRVVAFTAVDGVCEQTQLHNIIIIITTPWL
jgi:hypothetical protein